jgi:ubiquinone/menaquinone biosynthesis C-methylase UbiE
MEKKILDVTCGSRSIWFNKNHPLAVYCDIRQETNELKWIKQGRTSPCVVDPDVIADFTDLPFPDNEFSLVVMDPPHLEGLSEKSWARMKYGTLPGDWEIVLKEGFNECMRVLKPDGVLVFKWSEVRIPTSKLLEALGHEPLFGHKSGKKSNTNWLCFMKVS